MEMNNFQKLIQEREDLCPPELEYQVMRQASTMGHFGDMVSLFVLNTMATVVHIVTGGEEPKCLHDKRQRIAAEKIPLPGTGRESCFFRRRIAIINQRRLAIFRLDNLAWRLGFCQRRRDIIIVIRCRSRSPAWKCRHRNSRYPE